MFKLNAHPDASLAALSCIAAALTLTGCGGERDRAPVSLSSEITAVMPAGAPAAAFAPAAVLAEPDAWPFKQAAPKTSGTGRYAWGAYYWTDFLYDANGAVGADPPADHYGSPTGGGMRYPDEAALAGNGADIFRFAIGSKDGASYWRLDWQTLADVHAPIAAFGLDFVDGGLTSAQSWPGVPRLRAAGLDAVLLLSAAGYRLLDADGTELASGEVIADLASQSFVARVPAATLPVEGIWKVRVATGLHDGQGGFRDDPSFGGLPSSPPVFNVAPRSYDDESAERNFWMDMEQAQALARGDISGFVLDLDWGRLNLSVAEPEPMPTGFINRWYVSSLDPMAEYGRVGIDRATATAGGHPVYLDKVQPYGLYVPLKHDPAVPAPMTLTLHSGSQMHNQYGTTTPNFLREACEERGALCLCTLGRGPAGDFEGDAELDVWEAWSDVSRTYALDPARVHSSGYSMGGNATLRLLMKYPDVFAGGIVLAGGDDRVIDLRLLPNLLWSSYYHAQGSFDQMVPFPEARAIADELKALGYEYVLDHFLTEDHIAWALKDLLYPAFTDAAQWLANDARQTPRANPGRIAFNWSPDDVNPRLGLGPKGPWWLGDIQAVAGSEIARISAASGALPEPAIAGLDFSTTMLATPTPHVQERQAWILGETSEAAHNLMLSLSQVRKLSIDLVGAGFSGVRTIQLELDTDSSVEIVFDRAGRQTVLSFPAGQGQRVPLVFD